MLEKGILMSHLPEFVLERSEMLPRASFSICPPEGLLDGLRVARITGFLMRPFKSISNVVMDAKKEEAWLQGRIQGRFTSQFA